MIEIDWKRCKTTPYPHQEEGVRWLLTDQDTAARRLIPRVYLLGDNVGVGKSKQTLDSAQFLWEAQAIDTVVVCCPAFARGVWADPDPALGEIAKHGWTSVHNRVIEYCVKTSRLVAPPSNHLLWIVTNYEFIRRPERLLPLAKFLHGRRYWLVPDESWALADHTTAQWKAVASLRHWGWIKPAQIKSDLLWKDIQAQGLESSRITLLNGTPVADTPLDLYAQGRLLHSTIPGVHVGTNGKIAPWSWTTFRARYAVMRPNSHFPEIVGWQNLEELRDRFKPYILRREVEQCEILEPVLVEAKLKDETWRIYTQMRNEMVAWLSSNGGEASVAKQALVKGLRLAQITSGFLGGVEAMPLGEDFLDFDAEVPAPTEHVVTGTLREIGREKLDALIAWLEQLRPLPPRVIIWSRFRPEIERTASVLAEMTGRKVHKLYGGQSREERREAILALNPDVSIDTPVGVVAHAAAGGAALNFSGASLDITLSYDFSLRIYTQKRGRINRGLKRPIQYVDFVATGPRGQRTVNHHVLSALRSKEDIASWTAATWKRKLLEE